MRRVGVLAAGIVMISSCGPPGPPLAPAAVLAAAPPATAQEIGPLEKSSMPRTPLMGPGAVDDVTLPARPETLEIRSVSILVPELPTDLVRPQPVQDVPPLEAHLHLDGGPDPGSPPLAVRWIVERYTWRADEPAADRRHRLLPLASGPALDRLDVTGPPGRAGGVTAAWPADITGARRQGGWWLAFTLHTTGTEFMGVRSRKLTVEVVTEDGAVVDERSLPA